MEKVNKQVEKLNASEEFMQTIEVENDQELMINSARYEGKLDGIKQGKIDGIKQGIEQGIEQNKIEPAKSMLKENLDIELISKITGLTAIKINELKNN